jgi:hypothetical protein
MDTKVDIKVHGRKKEKKEAGRRMMSQKRKQIKVKDRKRNTDKKQPPLNTL